MPDRSSAPHPDHDAVVLRHPLFSKLGDIVFHLGEGDGVPVLAMSLGDRKAALPLRSLQLECGIADDSEDGRMLSLIARALAFVNDLRPGEALPAEVLGGEASWTTEDAHVRLAVARLELRLVASLDGGAADGCKGSCDAAIRAAADDPAMRPRVRAALAGAAGALGAPDARAVSDRLGDAARELAFVEALRARLLYRSEALAERLQGLARGVKLSGDRLEALTRVRRLAATAVARLHARFEDLDAQTADAVAFLRDLDDRRALIRAHRDWLYGSLRGWEPIFADWECAGAGWREATWPLLGRTYRFLAPRYMPMQEWRRETRAMAERAAQGGSGRAAPKQLVW